MAAVVLSYTYYLVDWSVSRYQYEDKFVGFGGLEVWQRQGRYDVVLTVSNPHPVDASFRVEIFGSNGVELTRARGPGGSGFLEADFGFPASVTLAPRSQIKFFLDPTTTNNDYTAYGWARIQSSLPVLLAARGYDRAGPIGGYIPIVSWDELFGPQAQVPGAPPRPPDPAGVKPPVLEEPPPPLDPQSYGKLEEVLARASADRVSAQAASERAAARILELDVRAINAAGRRRTGFWSLFNRGEDR